MIRIHEMHGTLHCRSVVTFFFRINPPAIYELLLLLLNMILICPVLLGSHRIKNENILLSYAGEYLKQLCEKKIV